MSAPHQPPSQTRSHPTRATNRRQSIGSGTTAAGLADTFDSRVIPLNPRAAARQRHGSHGANSTAPSFVVQSAEAEVDETRCWICFVSDSEEDVPQSEWRAPCRCSLVAHESCLLDWIADMQKSGRGDKKLSCPQCKTPIMLREKGSLVLDVVDRVGKIAGKAGAFVAFGGVGSVLFVGCTVYGVNTIYTICGPEYAMEVLLGPDSEFQWTWRLGVGLPLIPFVLIASRTRFFDSVLPVLPVVFFCHADPLHFTLPPSPQITLALLPYLRSFYNHLWKRYIASYEAQWIRETTPKFVLEAENQDAANAAAAAAARAAPAGNNNRRNRNRDRAADAAADAEVEDPVQVREQWNGEVVVENHNIILQGSNVTSLVLGALLWPSVAKMAGHSIGKWPAAWGGDRIRKWLPSQIARNVVGGLFVVVMKDFISLYCKYKRAQKFRSRSVMNYADVRGNKGKGKTAAHLPSVRSGGGEQVATTATHR